jgi:hypothetical protein
VLPYHACVVNVIWSEATIKSDRASGDCVEKGSAQMTDVL